MLVYNTGPGAPDCRYVALPQCEQDVSPTAGATVEALAVFQLRSRDTLDFTVDFGAWLQNNGGGVLESVTFAVASDSPKAPTIAGQSFIPAGRCVVVLSAPNGAAAGDAYYLEVTATVAAILATETTCGIPQRTLVRRIHVVLANG